MRAWEGPWDRRVSTIMNSCMQGDTKPFFFGKHAQSSSTCAHQPSFMMMMLTIKHDCVFNTSGIFLLNYSTCSLGPASKPSYKAWSIAQMRFLRKMVRLINHRPS